ncbi:MAG TPA: hypothetical protein VNQ79_08285 [Blastocatellia bacterium]|nr:hypothetical protein [Blastocatellia bacterium]
MNEQIEQADEKLPVLLEWNLASAEMAYSALATCLEHIQISGLVIAALAHTAGEDRLKGIVQSDPWQLYMASKRELEAARKKIAALTELIDRTRNARNETENTDGSPA